MPLLNHLNAQEMTPEEINSLAAQISSRYLQLRHTSDSTRQATSLNDQQTFLNRITPFTSLVMRYEDFELQEKARSLIPVDSLHQEAHQRMKDTQSKDFSECLIKSLMRWFKNDFFKWVDQPVCSHCHRKTVAVGTAAASPEESRHDAHQVELYRCQCGQVIRFPRYNDPFKLLDTRQGRCGEWANAFCAICRSMGFEIRIVVDFTDHLWTEVYSDHQRRWIHCDSCEGEGAYDTPLLYETGWGKKLSYIVATGIHDLVDVTHRYTSNFAGLKPRRNLVSDEWIQTTLAQITVRRRSQLSQGMKKELESRDAEERNELNATPSSSENLPARQSGAPEWITSRGEGGK